ncbi:hypothetical protein CMUS01_06415 [Colletotrichum musicola]|uniref:Uncharacterized protein n=1 Tax=Colletotrichum musicola TaxID=2175873 RepID=A0A8H6KMR4_9PEZI|nr:hypothetical protein CMUS01_06415 [Colletotrichum musicola]
MALSCCIEISQKPFFPQSRPRLRRTSHGFVHAKQWLPQSRRHAHDMIVRTSEAQALGDLVIPKQSGRSTTSVLLLAPVDLSNHGPPGTHHTTFPDAARRLQQRSAGPFFSIRPVRKGGKKHHDDEARRRPSSLAPALISPSGLDHAASHEPVVAEATVHTKQRCISQRLAAAVRQRRASTPPPPWGTQTCRLPARPAVSDSVSRRGKTTGWLTISSYVSGEKVPGPSARQLAAESKKALDQDTGSLVSAACHRICIGLWAMSCYIWDAPAGLKKPANPPCGTGSRKCRSRMACLRDAPALRDVLATRANYFPAPIPLDDSAQSNGLHQRISRAHAAPPARRFPFPQRLPQIPSDKPAPSARSRAALCASESPTRIILCIVSQPTFHLRTH